MASPPDLDCKNLSGKFVMNKTLSDDIDSMLALQGISWLVRKAIGIATVILTINEYQDDGTYHVDITSVASGLSSTQENRTLDWTDRDHNDRIFGSVKGRSRLTTNESFEMQGSGPLEDAIFLRAEKLKDMETDSKFIDIDHIHSWAVSTDGGNWTAEQLWGFEEVDEKRMYTRRVVVRKGDEFERVRIVYDYLGPPE